MKNISTTIFINSKTFTHMINKILSIAFLSVIILCTGFSSSAQQNNASQRGKNWISEVRNYKMSFLVKETEMTDDQQKKFTPLYNEMEALIYKTNRDARMIERKLSQVQGEITDAQYEEAAKALSQVKEKLANIENKYFAEFSKILSKKQIFLLKRAENRFSIEMLNHNKRSKTANE